MLGRQQEFTLTMELLLYHIDCGGNLSKSRGVVTSPLYPDRYPFNANCTSRVLKLTSKKVHVALTDLALASNHGVEVLAVSKNQTHYATKVTICLRNMLDVVCQNRLSNE